MLTKITPFLLVIMLFSCQLESPPFENNSPGDGGGGDHPSSTKPTASFEYTVEKRTVTVNATASQGNNLTYHWNFNNEAESTTGAVASYAFQFDGEKTITLVVKDNGVESDPREKKVTVSSDGRTGNTPPVALFDYSINGLTVDLDASSSSDADGDSLTYRWNINGEASRTGKTVSYPFDKGGKKTVSLTVKDGQSESVTYSRTFTLTAPPPTNKAPVADFTVSVNGMTIRVNGSKSSDEDGDSLTYQWNFGDGSTATGQTAEHTFSSEGNKTIHLVVHDGKTHSSEVTETVQMVKANSAPVAKFNVTVSDLTVSVDGSGSSDADGDLLSYQWDFGDGRSATGRTAQHTFNSGGDKTISLTVHDGQSDSIAETQTVQVTDPTSGGGIDYSDALAALASSKMNACLSCHADKNVIFFHEATESDIKNSIIDYINGGGSAAKLRSYGVTDHFKFSTASLKNSWQTVVDGIAQELNSAALIYTIGGTILVAEDFEHHNAGENPAGWGVNYQYNVVDTPEAAQFSDYIRVVDTVAHTGTQALYVDGRDLQSAMRYSYKALTLPDNQERVFVRYYLRTAQSIGNGAGNLGGSEAGYNRFMALESDNQSDIAVGESNGVLGVQEEGQDAIASSVQNLNGLVATAGLAADVWHCVQASFLNDGDVPVVKTWFDGELVTEINGSSVPANWLDNRFGAVAFGWANDNSYDNELYFDDIIVSTEQIECME